METLLITGGSGFIGHHLVEHFRNYGEVYHPTKEELDLTDKNAVLKYMNSHRVDTIIHSADVKDDFEINMRMYWNLCRYPILFLGSWDDRNDTPHGHYKKIATEYTALCPDKMATLRLFGVIGEGDNTDRFIPTIMRQSKAGEPITVTEDKLMEYSDVKDVCQTVEELVTGVIPLGVYDLISGNAEMLSVIGEYVAEFGGNKSQVIIQKACPEKDWHPTPASKAIYLTTKTLLWQSLRRVYNSL